MLLLDTCALLWLAADHDKLSLKATETIKKYGQELFISSISAFEIAIKVKKKKLELALEPERWYKKAIQFHGIHEIPINGTIALKAVQLPLIHNDPCDRFIIATAAEHNMKILTCDTTIAQYKEVKTIW